MHTEMIFQGANAMAMIGWLLLLCSPLHKTMRLMVQRGIIPIILAFGYAYFILAFFGGAEGSFMSLQGVMQLFTDEHAVLAGWLHYLVFDLWIGCWELGDSKKHGIDFTWMIPCFLLTFMFGPLGLLLYLAIRAFKTGKVLSHNNFDFAQAL